jgi:hypothetical protein
LVGIPGTIQMRFDILANRFTNQKGYTPFSKLKESFDFSDIKDIDF